MAAVDVASSHDNGQRKGTKGKVETMQNTNDKCPEGLCIYCWERFENNEHAGHPTPAGDPDEGFLCQPCYEIALDNPDLCGECYSVVCECPPKFDRKQKILDFVEKYHVDTIEDVSEDGRADFHPRGCEICSPGTASDVFDCVGHVKRSSAIEFKACNACLVGWFNDDFTGDDL